eukprot:TRINITY_DN10589_c0_g2_i1.p1 TRINITY_DN10589_c0_g2~~TRINITY_DN10589_c0_g2_i1.p1  ORF type:complete len:205 (+),score=44.04 TRINITY_DN10589_c0_g2_i1:112-726(+)
MFADEPEAIAWRWTLAVGTPAPVAIIFLSLFVMPESPRWLAQSGHPKSAAAVLRRVAATEAEAEETLAEIRAALAAAPAAVPGWAELWNAPPGLWRMTVVVVGVATLRQLAGVDAVMYYTPTVLEDAELGSAADVMYVQLGIGLTKSIVVLGSGYFSDHAGRRPLLLASVLLLAAACVVTAVGFMQSSNGSAPRPQRSPRSGGG